MMSGFVFVSRWWKEVRARVIERVQHASVYRQTGVALPPMLPLRCV